MRGYLYAALGTLTLVAAAPAGAHEPLWGETPTVFGFGVFIERHHLRLKEVDVHIKNLPKDLDQLRLVQLTDIHYGPYFGQTDLDGFGRLPAHIAGETLFIARLSAHAPD